MKKFTPFFDQYPDYVFWVRTKRIKDEIDQYVVIDHRISENKHNEMIGTVIRYIGRVGDLSIDQQLIREIAISNWNNLDKCQHIITQNISTIDLTPNRIDYTDSAQPIITIDPLGSIDRDDAVSYRRIANGHQISIHIADPSSYLVEGSEMDEEIKKRAETVYLNTTHHMFPQNLATEFSLDVDRNSRAFSVHLILDNQNQLVDRLVEKTLIRVTHNMDYDQYDRLLTSEEKTNYPIDEMRALYDVCKDLYKKTVDPQANNYNSKKMVECLMILANKTVAEIMIESGTKEPILIRSHVCSAHMRITENTPSNHRMAELNNTLQIGSAQLNLYDVDGYNRHDGLNLDLYTHFTSPIRRYSDILVHRTLYNILNQRYQEDRIFKNDVDQSHIMHMNTCKRYYKLVGRYERMIRLYNIISRSTDELKFEAKIIMINEKINRTIVLKVWVEDIYGEKDNIFSIKLIDQKMREFRTIEFEKDDQINSIKIINNGVDKIYKLYQSIVVGLIRCPLQMERIRCIVHD